MKRIRAGILSLIMIMLLLWGNQNGTARAEESPVNDDVQQILEFLENGSGDPGFMSFIGIDNYNSENVEIAKIKLVNAVKNNICTQYQSAGTFQAWNSDLWQYIVPVDIGNSVCALTFRKIGTGVEFAGSVVIERGNPSLGWYLVDDAEIGQILQTSGINRNSILSEQFMMAYMYRTLFYAFTTEQGEFLIPFSTFTDEENCPVFENGRIYTVDEVVGILDDFGLEGGTGNETFYGGIGSGKSAPTYGKTSDSKTAKHLPVTVGISAAVLCGIVLTVLLYKGKEKKYPLTNIP